jgi:predicted O-methyltransferase YrrM
MALYGRLLRRFARMTFGFWERLGLYVTPVHFYQPVPDSRRLSPRLWARDRVAFGVDFREAAQLELLGRFVGAYQAEVNALPLERGAACTGYYIRNGAFESVDGEILYSFIRGLKPRRVIEIGSGFSTLLIARALNANLRESGPSAAHTIVDPHPGAPARAAATHTIAQRVQDIPLDPFLGLEAGDVLFIDSSHVVATGSDVVHEILEILPRLRRGVIVHIHDVFMPAEYRREWLERDRVFWTEQYLVQAMLTHTNAWEILWAGSFMHLTHSAALASAFRSYDPKTVWPASLWLRRT